MFLVSPRCRKSAVCSEKYCTHCGEREAKRSLASSSSEIASRLVNGWSCGTGGLRNYERPPKIRSLFA